MKIATTGTYSTDKATTPYGSAPLAYISRTHAKTMRGLLPDVAPCEQFEFPQVTGVDEVLEQTKADLSTLDTNGELARGSRNPQ